MMKRISISLRLMVCFVLCLLPNQHYLLLAHASTQDPYRILDVSPSSTIQEIQKQYRSKCLKYHPDKNGDKSKKEKEKCEEMFKHIQHAYDLIGSPETKRKFDTYGNSASSSSPFTSTSSAYSASSPFGTDPVAQAFFRSFQSARNGPRFRYSNGKFGVQTPFPERAFTTAAGLSFKSIYVQKVQVPLEDLYKGVTNFRFHLVDNLWNRCRAAIRGKVMLISIYQGLIYSLPLLRTSKYVAVVACLVIAHATLPKPDPQKLYESTLRPGLKGGQAKVKFTSTSFMTPEVIFEIHEGPHKLYTRVDNDLHTRIAISAEEARNGCIKRIPSIDEKSSIEVTIKPSKVQDRDTIRIVGKGWPIKNAEDVFLYGDMVVLIRVQRRRRRGARNIQKHSNKHNQ
jgi:DnaJ-class molecular chaperone